VLAVVVQRLLALTPLGVRWRQARNRKRIEERTTTMCPLHGGHTEDELVRLPSGETICPQCYEEIRHADFDL
jgi:hypothetical protein